MSSSTGLLDLPVDLLLVLFPYLDARSFLNLTATCRALHSPHLAFDSAYWSSATRHTFRVPNQPVIAHDGHRWQKLYKRLLTQSRIFTWGNNEKACLGHSHESLLNVGGIPPALRHSAVRRSRHVSWPTEMSKTSHLGVIADMQCGGWSTTLLTSRGALYTVGVLDGSDFAQRRPPHMQSPKLDPAPLPYPPGFLFDRYEPSVAIKHFSAGRSHVLGLADAGRIWSWTNIEQAATHIKFLHVDIREGGSTEGSNVLKVVAGWSKSSALISGHGIILWEPPQRPHDDDEIEDTTLIMQAADVPRTSYRRSVKLGHNQPIEDNELIGELLNYVVLEHYVLFNTHLGKVFAACVTWSDRQQAVSTPFEVPVDSTEAHGAFITDVQGSFRSFALFTRSGEVLTGAQDTLAGLYNNVSNPSQPVEITPLNRIPALQHSSVISLAFGDYHFHALHSPGYITSYGTESQACGSLGLGGHGDPEGRLRGIRYAGVGGDGRLVPHANQHGRRVWFEPEKKEWITFLTSGGVDPDEAKNRLRMAIGSPDVACHGELSEWIEQEGRDWEQKFNVRSEDDDGLGAYFALSVTAAGWHSGALVLVNEDLAQSVRDACVVDVEPRRKDQAEAQPSVSVLPEPDSAVDQAQRTVSASSSNDQSTQQPGWIPSALAILYDYGRSFLGLPTTSSPPPAHPTPLHPQPYRRRAFPAPTNNQIAVGNRGANGQLGGFARFTHPLNHGASPRAGQKYIWADDHFPRLRLSDGREMPGTVGFSEWRYSKPEWYLGTL